MKLRFPVLLAAFLGATAPLAAAGETGSGSAKTAPGEAAAKAALPDYIRFVDDAQSARLEIAVKSFRLPSGAAVDLIGVVHIADGAYYADLNKRFAAYDAVLFELVGDPAALTKASAAGGGQTGKPAPGKSGLRGIQDTAARLLKLSFQLGQIDYSKPNMVHADTSLEEFERMQRERGESMLGLLMRAMKAQMNGDLDHLPAQELDAFGLLRILMSRDAAAEFKVVLAKMFDQAESMTSIMEGKEGSAILSGRNAVVMKKLRETLTGGTKSRVAVFYGAAHMPGIESLLREELHAEPAGEQWLPGWTMPHEAGRAGGKP